jgi:CDP-glycerol glycerophosphotransferase
VQVVFNNFNGRYSDSPRAVHEAVARRGDPHEVVWLVDPPHAGSFPSGVTTVPIYTDEAVRALESADLVVSNGHLEMDWTKHPGETYVQTWHGTPLKRIHADALGRSARAPRAPLAGRGPMGRPAVAEPL